MNIDSSNRHSFADTVIAGQNQKSSLCNDKTMQKVLQDIQLIKGFLIQNDKFDKQKVDSEKEVKRQKEVEQLKFEII